MPTAFKSDVHVYGILGHLSRHENARASHLHGNVLSTKIKVLHPLGCHMLGDILVEVLEGHEHLLVVGTLRVNVPCI